MSNLKIKKTLFNIQNTYLTMFEKPMVAAQVELYRYARLERVLIPKMGQIIGTVDWAYIFRLKSNLDGPLNKAWASLRSPLAQSSWLNITKKPTQHPPHAAACLYRCWCHQKFHHRRRLSIEQAWGNG
jgi:hypothetical protein